MGVVDPVASNHWLHPSPPTLLDLAWHLSLHSLLDPVAVGEEDPRSSGMGVAEAEAVGIATDAGDASGTCVATFLLRPHFLVMALLLDICVNSEGRVPRSGTMVVGEARYGTR